MPPPSRDYERGRDEPYKRLPDEAGGDDFPSDSARETAEALVAERAACRVSRDYQRADQIRDELRRAPHFVYISDKDRTWRRCSGGGPPPGDRDRPPRRDEPYRRLPDEEGATVLDDAARDAVERLVAERLQCKVSRDFRRADEIRDELRDNHLVYVSDKDRTWRRTTGRRRERKLASGM